MKNWGNKIYVFIVWYCDYHRNCIWENIRKRLNQNYCVQTALNLADKPDAYSLLLQILWTIGFCFKPFSCRESQAQTNKLARALSTTNRNMDKLQTDFKARYQSKWWLNKLCFFILKITKHIYSISKNFVSCIHFYAEVDLDQVILQCQAWMKT